MNMMKIGILTLPFHTNYGGIIQAYALQKVLKQWGHEVYFINKEYYRLTVFEKITINIKRIIKKILFIKNDEVIFHEEKVRKEYFLVRENIQQFVDSNLENIININDYRKVPRIFDAVIVGSDQIWNNLYVSSIEDSYLKFAKKWKIKRISYAASFGTETLSYTEQQKNNCKKLVQQFDSISVREKSGIGICKNCFNVQAIHVLDPTMLLPISAYIAIINECEKEDKKIDGEVFAYVLNYNSKIESIINKICDTFNSKVYYASTDRRDVGLEKRKTVKMGTWLNYFNEAKIIIADSFHACVFSIIFNKSFFVILNNEGNERIISLLNMFNLENRIIDNTDSNSEQILKREIDWNKVNTILNLNREKSLSFLQNSLAN